MKNKFRSEGFSEGLNTYRPIPKPVPSPTGAFQLAFGSRFARLFRLPSPRFRSLEDRPSLLKFSFACGPSMYSGVFIFTNQMDPYGIQQH